MAMIDFFDRGWHANPQGVAYIMGERHYTFDEIGELSCRIAHALLREQFSREAKGAVLAHNDPVAWTCVLGLWRSGLAWVPASPRNTLEENLNIFRKFDCEILFFQKTFAPMIDILRPQLPQIRQFVCIEEALGDIPSLAQWIDACPATAPEVNVAMDDVVMIASTGGTTGAPKGVMNTHRSLQTFFANYMAEFPYASGEPVVNLAAAPMTHTAGLSSLPCTARGGTVVVLKTPAIAALLDTIEQHRVTELFLPPTVIYGLLSTPGIRQRDFSSLKYFIYGAAPMSIEKLKESIEIFGPVMAGVYGQTEAAASISALRPTQHFVGGRIAPDQRLASVGLPCFFTDVAIRDQAGSVAAGVTGEICVRGDLIMKGYYREPEKTAAAIIDGWLHTGDLGHLDADGYLHITGRKKDMIISGGFNVYPDEIEQIIWGHPAVKDCAVIGVPHEKWGEAVKAVVELKPGITVDAEELIALCHERLGGIKTPKSIDFVDSLPRSAVGKVLKKSLRDLYWKDNDKLKEDN